MHHTYWAPFLEILKCSAVILGFVLKYGKKKILGILSRRIFGEKDLEIFIQWYTGEFWRTFWRQRDKLPDLSASPCGVRI